MRLAAILFQILRLTIDAAVGLPNRRTEFEICAPASNRGPFPFFGRSPCSCPPAESDYFRRFSAFRGSQRAGRPPRAARERFHALEGERSCIRDIVTIADNSVMNLILIILIVLLLFGGGGGYYYGGPVVGGGVGGLLLIVLVVYLLIGRRRV
jgi:hypothetical protein